MPIAAAMMPPSAIGVSSTRCSPYLRCRPSVTRNTPPKKPTSSPSITTRGSRPSITSIAEFSACTMFIRAMRSTLVRAWRGAVCVLRRRGARLGALPLEQRAHLLALALQIRRHVAEHVVEHGERVEERTLRQRSVRLGLLPAGRDVRFELLVQLRMALLGPLPERDQVLLETCDRISERPGPPFLLRAIARGIIARRVRRRAIGDVLDERGTGALPRALCRPLRDRVYRQEVVAIDADARNAVARAALREGAPLAPREALERGNGPLVVDQVQDHRRLVDGRE